MSNYDVLKNMTVEELGHFFCNTMEIIGENTTSGLCCSICPVENICMKGKNGFITWLEKEAEQ